MGIEVSNKSPVKAFKQILPMAAILKMASIMRKGDTPTPSPIYPTVFDVLFVADMNGLVRTGHPTSKELTKPRDYKPML